MSDFPTSQDEQDQLDSEWAHQQALDEQQERFTRHDQIAWQHEHIVWSLEHEIACCVDVFGKEKTAELLQEQLKKLK